MYKNAPYDAWANRDTQNATDSVFRNGGRQSMLAVRRNGAGYLASIMVGVHRL